GARSREALLRVRGLPVLGLPVLLGTLTLDRRPLAVRRRRLVTGRRRLPVLLGAARHVVRLLRARLLLVAGHVGGRVGRTGTWGLAHAAQGSEGRVSAPINRTRGPVGLADQPDLRSSV